MATSEKSASDEVGAKSSEGDASAQTVPPLIPPTCPTCPPPTCCPQEVPQCVACPCPTCPKLTCPTCRKCLITLPSDSRLNGNDMMTDLYLDRLLEARQDDDDDFYPYYDELW